jgi:hypothetical protein
MYFFSWPDDILARLFAAFDARQCYRPATWRARCPMPSHSRGDPARSLSIWLSCDRRWIGIGCWACRGRCGGHGYKADIVSMVGLTMGDLFQPRLDENGAYDWRNKKARPHIQPKIVAVYPYTDENGEVLYEKVRYEPKDFRLRRPDGHWGIEGVRRVPFQLCELLAKPAWPILYLEGEKDVLTAESLGLLATCVMEGGSGSGWDHDSPYPVYFQDRRVVVIPDEDAAGLNQAAKVVGALVLGGAASVRLAHLPGLEYRKTHGADLTTWVEAGGTRDELIAVIQSCKEWRPS